MSDLCDYYSGKFGGKCVWVDCDVDGVLFNSSWWLSPIGIKLQGPSLCWLLVVLFLRFSHAIIIKQRNRNRCDTGSVRKSRKINDFTTTSRLHNGYNPSIEFIIIGQSRHEKDLVLCLMRILARCVEVLRRFVFPLKTRSELFEAHAEFERSGFCP